MAIELKGKHYRKRTKKGILGATLVALVILLSASPLVAINQPNLESEQSEIIKEIKTFRKERDDFFKNHQRSPLERSDKLKFDRLSYYPIDLNYRFKGKIERYILDVRNPEYYATFLTNKGTKKRYIRYGLFRFALDGREYSLPLYKSILSDTLFIPSRDKTNGKETYSGGRYLDAEILLPGYETVIDFNMAYNPSCAYNDNFICVIPPKESALDIEIRAGEKKFK